MPNPPALRQSATYSEQSEEPLNALLLDQITALEISHVAALTFIAGIKARRINTNVKNTEVIFLEFVLFFVLIV